MKSYLSILMIICFATFSNAQNNFENQWEQVEKLEKDGLTKSAADLVDTIYKTANNTKNDQQRIKALLYKSKYMLILEEESQLSIVELFKSEINSETDLVTKYLLENMLATMYWQYFQQNRYRFYNRSKTSNKLNDDFRTWDLETLFDEIHRNFQKSLSNTELLKKESLNDYKTLLLEVKESKLFRPTLLDLLSHNALEFYKSDENSITKPAYKFKVDNAEFLSDHLTFSKLKIESKDTSSLQLNALKIYQNLINSHKSDESSYPLVTANIERLNFVLQHCTLINKEDLYLNSLQAEVSRINGLPQTSLYNFEIVSLYKKQANNYRPKDDTRAIYKWKLKDALELCEKVVLEFPESRGAKKCKILIEDIKQPNIRLQVEEHLPINTHSRILVNYKNLSELDFNIYKIDVNQLQTFKETYRIEDQLKFFKKLKPIKSFKSTLKTEGDFQNHSTEIILPPLTNGFYLIKADTGTDSVFAITPIQVTDLALIETNQGDVINYQLINRLDGSPIKDAVISISYKNNRNRHFNKMLSTDSKGKFTFKKDKNYYRDVEIRADHKNDMAFFGEYYISRKRQYQESEDTRYNVFIFTDRSIYRPGQTLYFKGIATATKNGKTKVFAENAAKVKLQNVNGEVVSELLLQTNEFGSVNGEFIIPNDGLTGNYSIEMFCGNFGYTSFSVEEYKRPKFKAEFNPITDTYKVNDSITIKGIAKAFAGSNITDAKVVFRVKRQVQFPNWWYWRRPNYYSSEAQEITFGESKTNDKGEFEITFKAIPDESLSKEQLPIFIYEVTADITDINGETRSARTVVKVGYHAMILQIAGTNVINKTKKKHEITISSQNLNGEKVPAKGTLKIYRLIAPDRILRARPWEAPDYQVILKDDFETLFPHDSYMDENKLANWEKGDLVYEADFNTETDQTLILKKIKNWDSGKYLIIAESKDKYGQDIKDEIFTTLYSESDKTVSDNELFTASLDKDYYNIGDIAKLTLGSAAKGITVTVEVEKDNKIFITQIVELNNSKQTISIPIVQGDLGGFIVHTSFAAFNSFKTKSFKINVPYPKTDLNIETLTFRDKLQPGQNETWSFKIKGPKGEKVSAELLASMYDASLDEFRMHNWNFNPIYQPEYFGRINKNYRQSFGTTNFRLYNQFKQITGYPGQNYDQLNWFGFYFADIYRRNRFAAQAIMIEDSAMLEEAEIAAPEAVMMKNDSADFDEVAAEGSGSKAVGVNYENLSNISKSESIQIRKNLNETAFFFPTLQTDKDGNVSFNFTAPEALTQWKLQLLAHTKNLESTVTQLEAVTQKELMVIPNTPRFLREGDHITISTKIANLTDKLLSGTASLQLTNALNGEDITEQLLGRRKMNYDAVQLLINRDFDIDKNGNTQVSWVLSIPKDLQAVQYQIIAKAEDFSDGEQNTLPVLSNRMLVTETLPMWVRSNQTKTFTLNKLKNNTSTSLSNHKLTLEMTSNPAWYAVQALPYLMEYPYDCNEQIFARYYANSLAQHIVNSNPKIKVVFDQWKSSDVLISNLEKNQELKSLLIEETPWLRDAQSETEQKKRIGLLFDLNKMSFELQSAKRKLKNNQLPSGAWSWFNGGRDNRYITQYIIAGFGHLKHLNVEQSGSDIRLIQNGLRYLDREFIKEYKNLKKYNKDVDLSKDHLTYMQLHYLYVRSFFPEIKISNELKSVIDYYLNQIQSYWLDRSLYAKALMALVAHRNEDNITSKKILRSLKENSITSDELGMYWKENTNSWFWYQAPIETQALLIEAFSEIENDINTIDNLKIWLLKNKQTNQWKTTKATTEAVYALLLQGSDWLSVTDTVDVKVGNETISTSKLDNVTVEAGTGYYKTSWTGSEIKPEQAEVTLTKKEDGIAWGALYWQYFEDLDKITTAETPLKLSKKLFLKTNTDKGEVISEITSESPLKVGDLVRVRIELRTDRNMEFIHLKDMRAAGFEPINVLSQYKWQDGLGYYESTRDAATNFFIDYLPKGVYVFEYDLRVNNAGDMSNGISTIQSMYAPEFSSHSEGIRITAE